MRIEKLGYSSGPWRLVDRDGREVDYVCPKYGYTLPVCADTKTALVEMVLGMYEAASSELRSARTLIRLYEETIKSSKCNSSA